MPSIANIAQRAKMIDRVQALSPDCTRRWGSMTAPEMLAHCADAMRMGLGDLPCTTKDVPLLRLGITKWLMFNVLPFPKSTPTAPELRSRAPLPWEEERASLIALINRAGTAPADAPLVEHPVFGPMKTKEWCQLAYAHLNHHLKQFGG